MRELLVRGEGVGCEVEDGVLEVSRGQRGQRWESCEEEERGKMEGGADVEVSSVVVVEGIDHPCALTQCLVLGRNGKGSWALKNPRSSSRSTGRVESWVAADRRSIEGSKLGQRKKNSRVPLQ